jgi:hypothetical protein
MTINNEISSKLIKVNKMRERREGERKTKKTGEAEPSGQLNPMNM